MNTFYDLTAKTPSGEKINMADFKGKPVLVVNTATRCGLTPQFEGLEKLHQAYKELGLIVLGFPCNQFGGQEPESNENIETVCLLDHGVTFTLSEKVDVNGPKTHPVFQFLKKEKRGFLFSTIKWNFTKFLIDQQGIVIKRYAPTVKPAAIEADIKKLLS
ncbi:MAG TPA: glutathione peroxidase [Bacteroidetes bacterium]|jgi:glutathione peroxidase|nr:glutathione peroxidase [Bacteroidota bacterium]|tara:strand:+ start:1161 stop:1640 length:480 start_codon:yes stop_codon:yes gene_type:complete